MRVEHLEQRRWLCYSVSRPELPPYLTDMAFSEQGEMPHPYCDCWPFKRTKKPCVHIKRIQLIEQELMRRQQEDETQKAYSAD